MVGGVQPNVPKEPYTSQELSLFRTLLLPAPTVEWEPVSGASLSLCTSYVTTQTEVGAEPRTWVSVPQLPDAAHGNT